jgi:hypothetical protein
MTDLPVYGRLFVTNSHASSVENVAMTMASNSADDTTTVSFPIAPMTTLVLSVVVRRVPGAGADTDINMVLVAKFDFVVNVVQHLDKSQTSNMVNCLAAYT